MSEIKLSNNILIRGVWTATIRAHAVAKLSVNIRDLTANPNATAYWAATTDKEENGLTWDYEPGDVGKAQWEGVAQIEVFDPEFSDWVPLLDWLAAYQERYNA